MNSSRHLATLLFVIGGVCGTATAGPLLPPAGSVAPSYKTLSQVEPRTPIGPDTTPNGGSPTVVYRIGQPGSYYLTQNLTGEAGKFLIRVDADNVTIDLNGYTMIGVTGSLDAINGSLLEPDNVTVKNGVIRGFDDTAIEASPTANGWVIENVTMSRNGAGVSAGRHAILRNCHAVYNQGSGISALWGSVIENCTASGNGTWGISGSYGTTIRGCAAQQNSGAGISAHSGSTVVDCSARQNGVEGIKLDSGSSAINCTSSYNTTDGIWMGDDCTAQGNTCSENGNNGTGAGVRASGGGNRIDGNHVTLNDLGIRTDGSNNIVVRNTARGNATAFSYAGTNTVGPTVAASGTIASTSPWANFSH
jgi:parallel beta-helix repeat protein